ncbi:ORF-124 [Teiidae poxvirus 1]|nr:ORF-124 [Teiidae poxvirus 1]
MCIIIQVPFPLMVIVREKESMSVLIKVVVFIFYYSYSATVFETTGVKRHSSTRSLGVQFNVFVSSSYIAFGVHLHSLGIPAFYRYSIGKTKTQSVHNKLRYRIIRLKSNTA